MSDVQNGLPPKIKVGSFTFTLEQVPGVTPELGEGNWGMTLYDTARILLNDSMGLDRLVNTVLHEIGHAINHSYGLGDESSEEAIATQSANGWMQVYLDNQKLEMWLHRAWRELRKFR